MTFSIFYISWSTWVEKELETPWDFWYVSQGNTYKPRDPSISPPLDSDAVELAFMRKDAAVLNRIEAEYVNDVQLMAFIAAENQESAMGKVRSVFPDAEFGRVQEIDPATKDQILNLIAGSQQDSPG
jgi:hypothetical protein